MKLYNTLTRGTEPFSPSDDIVKMYVCGLTPYAPAHIGHAMRAVVFDVLRRYLEFKGYKVRHVENFTDIDDKMIQFAGESGRSTDELAEEYIRLYFENMDALNVLRADIYPRATQEIPRMQKIIAALVEQGSAYAVEGDVYFRVRQHEGYGKLGNRSLDSMRAGARVEVDEKKEDEMDFVLWKSHTPGEPSWDSPWGPGRPGWHIECSAMSLHYLGETLDIHGGGQDLVFPHHENEIAQSESYTKTAPMARFWVHNGFVRLGEDKMSKSLGNFITVSEALERYTPDALRLFFLGSHYRAPLTYTEREVVAQERAAARLLFAARRSTEHADGPPLESEAYRERFVEAMDEDLNTPRALAALFDLAHEINRAGEEERDVGAAQATLLELAAVLGLTLKAPADERRGAFLPLLHLLFDSHAELQGAGREDLADRIADRFRELGGELGEFATAFGRLKEPSEIDGGEVAPLIELLMETRAELRASKQYDMADRVRQRLAELGYALEDTSRGTVWRRTATH